MLADDNHKLLGSTRESHQKEHEYSIEKLEELREKTGDENFIRFLMIVLKTLNPKQGTTPQKIADMCEACPKYLYIMIQSYFQHLKGVKCQYEKFPDYFPDNCIDDINKQLLALGLARI